RLLIVDEPTVGLDPEERVRFRNLLADLSGDRIVLLSTHIVSDVEAAATSIALIDRGRLVDHAPPEALLAALDGKVWEHVVASDELAAGRERWLVTGRFRRSAGVPLRIVGDAPPGALAKPLPPSLEDAYLDRLAGGRTPAAA